MRSDGLVTYGNHECEDTVYNKDNPLIRILPNKDYTTNTLAQQFAKFLQHQWNGI